MTLVLITPADDYQLLSQTERRLAAGLAADDDSQDATLETLGLEAAEWVAAVCGVPAADGYSGSPPLGSPPVGIDTVPTFRQEVVQEVRQILGLPRTLTLARRFVSSVTVTLNDVVVETTDFRVNGQAGSLERVVGGIYPACWGSGTLVVTYTAGFAVVPPAIKLVAKDYLALRYSSVGSEIGIRSKTINDIESVTYRSDGDLEASLYDAAIMRLSRYITHQYG